METVKLIVTEETFPEKKVGYFKDMYGIRHAYEIRCTLDEQVNINGFTFYVYEVDLGDAVNKYGTVFLRNGERPRIRRTGLLKYFDFNELPDLSKVVL